ncbi:MAG: 2-oxo acid dehydrogenase subunit E2 [Chloroflexi bacterium]|nr:2-oxo acid dehydrogenase subunit E2 [Chloroflexota bacterium]
MPTEVAMPRLGWDMQVGSIAEWLKREGDQVEAGDAICMIAGDKATTELEAPESGTLHISPEAPEPGVEVPVGTLLAYLLGPGEDVPQAAPGENAPVAARQRIVATPRARRAAAQLGLDWRTLNGTGRGGRILERDVQAAQPQPQPASTSVRRLTADRMARSASIVAPVTLVTEADATELTRLRSLATEPPSITALLVKITAIALLEHPLMNSELTDAGVVQHTEVNVAIAIDSEHGLVAPVIRDAATSTVETIEREAERLIDAARSNTLRGDDLQRATFTISNVGMYEIDAFTPIVNLPNCAILGVGRIVPRPVVVDETEKIAVRRMVTLNLTFDHRVVDGAPAARFLQRIKHLVERPTLWLFR